MAAFVVRGLVNGKPRTRLCFGWSHAVTMLATLQAEGAQNATISPVGRLERE